VGSQRHNLETLIERFKQSGIDIYGIDATPPCFMDKHVYATRAFSPHLFTLQYTPEDVFDLPVGPRSVKGELPQFFLCAQFIHN